MKRVFLIFVFWFLNFSVYSQTIKERLQKAYRQFENDEQLKHAISSFYVIDAKTGKVVFDKNSQKGLAGASTQKIVTAATAFELLGKDYKYKTELGHTGTLEEGTVKGNLFLIGNGDPTLGSWRWNSTKPGKILYDLVNAIRGTGIRFVRDYYDLGILHFGTQSIPNGWIWEDVGNYYGAGAVALNWRENQFSIFLESGSEIGDSVTVSGTEPVLFGYSIRSEVTSNRPGSGDNAYAYLPLGMSNQIIVRGTIPVKQKKFSISAVMPDPPSQLTMSLMDTLMQVRTSFGLKEQRFTRLLTKNQLLSSPGARIIYIHYSPSMDSVIYWFLKKSVNLYGEALVKTFSYEKQGFGSTDSGLAILKRFWKEKGIDEDELNIYDGSGLSPLNRVTTHAQVQILKYARSRDWFPYFFDALPEYNGMKIKSGTISDVKGYCGYHTSKTGKEYIFSFLVNNYSGRSSTLVSKMYKVLDVLK